MVTTTRPEHTVAPRPAAAPGAAPGSAGQLPENAPRNFDQPGRIQDVNDVDTPEMELFEALGRSESVSEDAYFALPTSYLEYEWQ
jgi:hypothetical protein